MQFYKVEYKTTPPAISCFESLGRPNMQILNAGWYTDGDGNESSSSNGIFKDEKRWRTKYWAEFYRSITTKLEGWAHEDEYRLILSPSMMDFSEAETRKLKYSLTDLDGIIFGMNTSIEDKLKIIRIINRKCAAENRDNFKFYQASFGRGKSEIEISELNLLKTLKSR